jgi:hypothetical protein
MKFVISLGLLVVSHVSAFPVRIYFEETSMYATEIKKELIENYRVPEELIEMKRIENCIVLPITGRLDLCLKNNGDLLMVSVDREFINESLRIFRAP